MDTSMCCMSDRSAVIYPMARKAQGGSVRVGQTTDRSAFNYCTSGDGRAALDTAEYCFNFRCSSLAAPRPLHRRLRTGKMQCNVTNYDATRMQEIKYTIHLADVDKPSHSADPPHRISLASMTSHTCPTAEFCLSSPVILPFKMSLYVQ